MKGPFSKEETDLIQSWIYDGLKSLKDVGKGVHYEGFCKRIIQSVPESILAPEFIKYWEYWKNRFERETDEEKGKELFVECILDMKNKGLLPTDTSGLTGNFSNHIQEIISKKNQI